MRYEASWAVQAASLLNELPSSELAWVKGIILTRLYKRRPTRRWWVLRDQNAIIIGANTMQVIGE